ncbi:type III secretion system stator protein SctL [Marinibactrum halimedae]|uniref:Type 3 secretion system stator protein n=1 Tax=Marinibactrum halimedae TaxID=1444977 RepID=A0AA37WM94_9GAMM|nr:type III secretion system stator protein SctL [Marinibactrum halimedae]MCD9459095.1 type III secretion system stator protein SctL [Marinibactrum halimedae]GLS24696.1 hypothetical protein GCM10007877_04100 [Marinibactrum halimedae]
MSAAIKITPQKLTIDASTKIVKRSEYQYFLEGEAIVAEAKEKAKQIVKDAEREKQKACEEGYRKGFEAVQSEQAEIVLTTLKQAQKFLESRADNIANLVIEVSRKLLGEMEQEALVLKLVEQALNTQYNVQKVILRVAPQQYSVFSERVKAIRSQYSGINQLDVKEDDRVNVGSCLMETPMGILTIDLESQLNAIERSLSGVSENTHLDTSS